MRVFLIPWVAAVSILLGSCASSPPPARHANRSFYRAYALAEISPALRVKVEEAERRHGVIAPADAITMPAYRGDRPQPFTVEIRRTRQSMAITVFVLIDERGEPVSCEVIDATDEEVARKCGPIMCAARYVPARIEGKPVACAATFTMEGAYIPLGR